MIIYNSIRIKKKIIKSNNNTMKMGVLFKRIFLIKNRRKFKKFKNIINNKKLFLINFNKKKYIQVNNNNNLIISLVNSKNNNKIIIINK